MNHVDRVNLTGNLLAAVRVVQLHGRENRATETAIARLVETLEALFGDDREEVSLQIVDRFLLIDRQPLPERLIREEVTQALLEIFEERAIGGLVFRTASAEPLLDWICAFAQPVAGPDDAELLRAKLMTLGELGVEVLEPMSFAATDEAGDVDANTFGYALEMYGRAIVGTDEVFECLAQGREPFSGRIPIIRAVQELIDVSATCPEHLLEILERERVRAWSLEERYATVHAVNTCVWSILIGKTLELDRMSLLGLATGALLADVGFALVPGDLQNQPRELTREEQDVLMTAMIHESRSLMGEGRATPESMRRAMIAYEHHGPIADPETGASVHPFSRIVAVADAFDALTHSRSWREAMSPKQALGVLKKGAGLKFDPVAVSALGALLTDWLSRAEAYA